MEPHFFHFVITCLKEFAYGPHSMGLTMALFTPHLHQLLA